MTVVANPSWNYKLCPGLCLLVKGAGDISHNSHTAGNLHSTQTVPLKWIYDYNTVEQSELNYVPQKTNFRHPHLHLSSTLTHRPSISPSSLCKPSPPTLIKVKESFQIADEGWRGGRPLGCLWTWAPRTGPGLNSPGDSRFGVIVYPPPGQFIHTLTPACQRREKQDIGRERTERVR